MAKQDGKFVAGKILVGELNSSFDEKANVTTVAGIDTRLTTAEGKISTAETDIDNLQSDLTTAKTDIETNKTNIATNTKSIQTNATKIANNTTSINTNADDIANLKTEKQAVAINDAGEYFTTDTVEGALQELGSSVKTLQSRGRFLSIWDCIQGEPQTQPSSIPYEYATGDYYIVGTVGTTNYRPTGTSYDGKKSTVIETEVVTTEDVYYYDNANGWLLQKTAEKIIQFENIAGEPTDNSSLASALNAKQDILTQGTNITIEGTKISAKDTTYTQGTNITIDGDNKISAVDTKYTAGTNVSIDGNNKISAIDTTYSAGTNITIDANNKISSVNTDTKNTVGNEKKDDQLFLVGSTALSESSGSYAQSYGNSNVYMTGGVLHASSFDGKATSAGTADTATKATNADNATTAQKLGTANVGDSETPIYLKAGSPAAVASIDVDLIGDGEINNDKLANKGVTIAGTSVNLGGSISTDTLKSNLGLSNYKTKQSEKADPTASGNATSFIDSITQNANGEITATKKSISLDNYKTKQNEKADPTASGNSVTFIDSITQNANGEITATKKTINYTTLDSKYKKVQTEKTSPTASGNATSFIDTISQDTQGVITATKKTIDLSGYKTKQSEKTDPTASGTATSFIDSITQDANGVIVATKKTVDFPSISDTKNTVGNTTTSDELYLVGSKTKDSTEGYAISYANSNVYMENGTLTASRFAGALNGSYLDNTTVANTKLVNDHIGIAGKTVDLGSSVSASELKTALGLDSAMHYIGVTTTAISDGSTTQTITIGGASVKATSGDIAIYGESEFIWNGEATTPHWDLLGVPGDWKPKQTAVPDPTASGYSVTFIDSISQDINGVITPTKKTINYTTLDTRYDSKYKPLQVEKTDPTASGNATSFIDSITQDVNGVITATKKSINIDLSNYKTKQTAKTDPTASGSSVTFIDSITQDTNGVITATKKTINYTTLDGKYKVIQSAVSDPTASGNATAFIDSISQNTQGVITVTKKNIDLSNYKTKQTKVTDPTASGYSTTFIDSISQSENGVITATKKTISVDLSNYKTKQSAISDPTASGNSTTFIDTISQDANGVITATKKTVSFPTDQDTKNTVGNTKNASKIYLVGPTALSTTSGSYAVSYGNDSVYMTNGALYSSSLTTTGNITGGGSLFIGTPYDDECAGAGILVQGHATTAKKGAAVAMGEFGTSGGAASLTMGYKCETATLGDYSAALGYGTYTSKSSQFAIGKYNVIDTDSSNYGKYAVMVGNGDPSSESRSNAYALDWDGNGYYDGDIYVNCSYDSTGGTKVATLDDLTPAKLMPVSGSEVVIERNGIAETYMGTYSSSNVKGIVTTSTTATGVTWGAPYGVRAAITPSEDKRYERSDSPRFVYGFGTSVLISDLKDHYFTVSQSGSFEVFNTDGQRITSSTTDNLGTGMTIKVYDANGQETEELITIVFGDLDGDGEITTTDIALSLEYANQYYILDKFNPQHCAILRALDLSHDNIATTDDSDIFRQIGFDQKAVYQTNGMVYSTST